MSKAPLNEGLITRALTAIFTAVASGRKDIAMKAAQNDPIFQSHVENLEKLRKDMAAYIERKRKYDSEFRKTDDWVNKILER